jgi:RNA polymerase sigma factor (sigma-70 family)
MATEPVHPTLRFVRHLAAAHLTAALPDAQLLERFAQQHDEAAFTALVRRHGPLVLGACVRVLNDRHAAEDAFQVTFAVLARKAGSLKRPEALGPWLYGVATRTALKAKSREARRRACERRVAVTREAEQTDDLVWRDLRPVLDEAVARLPEKYRTPFLLHHLEGLTVAEVARRLVCPQGTVAARLARAKERLRTRLARRGLTLSAALLGAAWQARAAAVTAPLERTTVEAALAVAAHNTAGGLTSAAVAVLTKGVLKAMSVTKLKVAVALALLAGGFGLAVTAGALRAPATEPVRARQGAANGAAQVAPAGTPRRPAPVLPAYVIEPPDILLVRGSPAVTLPGQPLDGQHLVRPDGTISLGGYGVVRVTGLTLDQAADAIADRLREGKAAGRLSEEQVKRELTVDVLAYNSKVYYVITDLGGQGEQVYRLPSTGNETVLDAVGQINDVSPVSSKCRVWVERANAQAGQPPQVLPVNWKAICQDGVTETNYALVPGDRVYVRATKPAGVQGPAPQGSR